MVRVADYRYFSASQAVVFASGNLVALASVVAMATLRLREAPAPAFGSQQSLAVLTTPIDTARVSDVLMCMSTPNAISGLPSDGATPNKLLYAGAVMADAGATSCLFPPTPPPSPPSPPPPPGICLDSCNYASDADCGARLAIELGSLAHMPSPLC